MRPRNDMGAAMQPIEPVPSKIDNWYAIKSLMEDENIQIDFDIQTNGVSRTRRDQIFDPDEDETT